MQVAHAAPGEQRDLRRAKELRAPEMRAGGIERSHPAAQRLGGQRRQLVAERGAPRGIERGLVEQRRRTARADRVPCRRRRAGSRPAARVSRIHSSARSAHHAAEARSVGSSTSMPRCGTARRSVRRRLRGADVEAAIELPRVGADDDDVRVLRESEREPRLPRRRRSADDTDGRRATVGQSGARARTTRAARWWTGRARRAREASCRRARRTARASRPARARRRP